MKMSQLSTHMEIEYKQTIDNWHSKVMVHTIQNKQRVNKKQQLS